MVLASFGTDGDVLPYIGLGAHLRERGHRVTLASSGHYQSAAAAKGMSFQELIPRVEVDHVLADPDFWHPLSSGPKAARWGGRFLRANYDLLRELAREPGTVLVANPGVLAARLLHEREGTPLATIVLQPWMLPSAHRPPMMLGGMTFPAWGPRWLWRWYVSGLNQFGDYLVNPYLNVLREELGLARGRRLFDWWFSPQLILGFFTAEFGPPQPDWPPQVRLLSFPCDDGEERNNPAEVEAFLQAGEPPVAVTFGTGVQHAAKLYQAAVEACVRLGLRVVVATRHAGQLAQPLSPGVMITPFAPFSRLFARCAAVIHHGGIGTTAQALATGVPQVIIPLCYDQLDNAVRVKGLGGGNWISSRNANSRKIAVELEKSLQGKPPVRERVNKGIDQKAFARAAELLEEMG